MSYARTCVQAVTIAGLVGAGFSAPLPARGAEARTGVRAMHVFAADSLTKVLREPDTHETPPQDGPVRISAARNERESFQVVVDAGVQPRHGVRVSISDLAQVDGPAAIPAGRVLVNPVGYVQTQRPAYPVARVGWWPDPLLPPGPVSVPPGHRQPFWLTVHVPEDAPAGAYTATVTVSADGHEDRLVPLELRVWDFTLAPTPPLPSAVAIYPEILARFYHQHPVSEATLRSYWDMLFSHRLSSDVLGDPLPDGIAAVIAGRATSPFDVSALDRRLEYCFPRGLTSFQAARLPGFQDEGPDLLPHEQERLVAYLGELAEHLDQRGWLDRAFVLVWDEPRDRRAHQVLKELQVVRRAHPRLRRRLDGPVTGPLVELCDKEVDIWCMHMLNIARGGVQAEANIARWRREGRSIWMYVACDVHHPYPNVFIDYPLIDCRVLPWLHWRYDTQALLYWSANWFGDDNLAGDDPAAKWPHRPWVAGNFVEDPQGEGNRYNGDGHLIYPGPNGLALSSVRLEALRDGMEDYEYLFLLRNGAAMLERAGLSPDLVAEARRTLDEQPVARSFTDWARDSQTLLQTRERLAGLIERVYQAALH